MDYLFHKVKKVRLLSIFLALSLGACIQEDDLIKLQTQQIDGWTYLASTDKDGQPKFITSNQVSADETGINVKISFECNRSFHLGLLLETFAEGGNTAAPIKMRQAHSAFGRFSVADIRAYNNQTILNWVGTEVGERKNSIMIDLAPSASKIEKNLKLPTLKITIPTIKSPRDVTIRLDNPNIQKVFADCQFKPAFLHPKNQ